jgi:hypothetical protein
MATSRGGAPLAVFRAALVLRLGRSAHLTCNHPGPCACACARPIIGMTNGVARIGHRGVVVWVVGQSGRCWAVVGGMAVVVNVVVVVVVVVVEVVAVAVVVNRPFRDAGPHIWKVEGAMRPQSSRGASRPDDRWKVERTTTAQSSSHAAGAQ